MKIEYKLTKLKFNTLIYREVEMLQHQQQEAASQRFMISGNCWREARVSLRGSCKESKKRETIFLGSKRGSMTTTTTIALTMKHRLRIFYEDWGKLNLIAIKKRVSASGKTLYTQKKKKANLQFSHDHPIDSMYAVCVLF
jgi:hypothetical protein